MNEEAKRYLEAIIVGIKETDRKQEDTLRLLNRHIAESGVRDQKLTSELEATDDKLDDHLDGHKENRGWWATLWSGVILALIGAVFASIKVMTKP